MLVSVGPSGVRQGMSDRNGSESISYMQEAKKKRVAIKNLYYIYIVFYIYTSHSSLHDLIRLIQVIKPAK